MVLPILAIAGVTAIGGLLGFFGGKSAGGGAIEIGTSKKSSQTTTTSNQTTTDIYSPTINRTYDIQYNIASGESSSVSTKKEQAITQTPEVSPQIIPSVAVTPQTSQGGGIGASGSGFNINDLILVGALTGGGYLVYKVFVNDKKK